MVNNPSISVNKLAEYIVCKAARKRKILSDRKYPDPEFNPGIFHREAAEAISLYLAEGAVDPSPLTKQQAHLNQIKTDKVGTARRISANVDALERFSEMLDNIDMDGLEPKLGPHNPPKLTFHNVDISVRPEIIIRGTGPKGKKYVGGWKLHFSKTHPHTKESADYVSAVLQEFCKLHVAADDEIVHPLYCKVIDVASGTVFDGVKSTTALMKDVAAECQNMKGIWDTI
ncbi:hypothetical protein ABVB70_26650 [Agrobacterium radiobacter]|uniref:Uncharacterized protein n=1 Tax=Agrobacterium radiobacter TaxID=362 RepID=A0ABD5LPP9_AGRRD